MQTHRILSRCSKLRTMANFFHFITLYDIKITEITHQFRSRSYFKLKALIHFHCRTSNDTYEVIYFLHLSLNKSEFQITRVIFGQNK